MSEIYTHSDESKAQRRGAAKKTGAASTTSDAVAGTVLAATFEPFPEADEDPAQAFIETLEAIKNGESDPWDEIDAAYLTLLQVNLHALAKGGAVVESDEEFLALNLELVAVREIQACHKAFRSTRAKRKPKNNGRHATAMQKKLERRKMQDAMQGLAPVN